MKKMIFLSLSLILTLLSSCSFFHIHKIPVEQGNIMTEKEVHQLHRGMTPSQVKAMIGTPLLVNLFNPHRIEYIYTYQKAGQPLIRKRLTCLFRNGRLTEMFT